MTVEPTKTVQQKNSIAPPGGHLDNRITRSLIRVGDHPSTDDARNNWTSLQDYLNKLPGESEDLRILDYLHQWYRAGNQDAPPFELVKEYFEKADELETSDRLDEIKNAQVYIRTNFLSIVNAAVAEKERRDFIFILNDARRIAENGVIKDRRTLRGIKDSLDFLLSSTQEFTSTAAPVRRVLSGMYARVLAEKEKRRTSIGLDALDEAINGGLPGSTIHVVTAPPGNYKSTYLCHLAIRLAKRGSQVAYLSCDEGPLRTATRLMGMNAPESLPITLAGLDSRLEVEAEFVARGQKAEIRAAAIESILGRPHAVNDEHDELVIAREIRTKKLDVPPVLIVDSLQCVPFAGHEKYRDEYSRINAVMERMRELAERLGLIIIVASEANRSSFSKKNDAENSTGLSAGKGSSAIEFKADLVATLRKQDGMIRMKVVKNRLGQDEPELFLTFDGRTLRETTAPVVDELAELNKFLDIIRGNPNMTSVRAVYLACQKAGMKGGHDSVDTFLCNCRERGLLEGGGGKPFIVIEPPQAEELLT